METLAEESTRVGMWATLALWLRPETEAEMRKRRGAQVKKAAEAKDQQKVRLRRP
jgi:hypothetical protein